MKTLLLVRHAKSSWEHDVIDHERPLNERGIKDAGIVSHHLKKSDPTIEAVLCSDSTRTRDTAAIFFKNLELDASLLQLNHDLYDFAGSNLLRVIEESDNTVNNLMVFGHNHAITSFVNSYGSVFIENVPTCGVVQIEFNSPNWKGLTKGKTLNTLFPKELK